MRTHLKWIVATVTASLIALSPACAQAPAGTPKKGGTLNFAVVAEPPNYDCHANVTFGLIHPIAPHYSLLLKLDGKEYPKIVGDLAQSWTVSPDGLEYTFKLYPNATFHDGAPVTSVDVKATYERIINPPEGVVSVRKAYYSDFGPIETPAPDTIVFKMKTPIAGVLGLLASPFNCIYSAAKLKQNPKYPETEIYGSGAYTFVENVRGSHWIGKRYDKYFKTGLPYLDGYKAIFVKSPAVVPGLLGGQFDAEFRYRSPPERDQLMEKAPDKFWVGQTPLLAGLIFIFNTKKKPFDDIRVRQAVSLAIDRWSGAVALDKIAALKFVGGIMRPGSEMALPEAELVKLPGFSKDAAKSREEAKRLLKEAGVDNLSFKLLNRSQITGYTAAGVYALDQWKKAGLTVTHDLLETKTYQAALAEGNFDVAIEFISDYMDDPTMQFTKFLTRKISTVGYTGHEDAKVDEMYERQRRTLDPAERLKIVRELDAYNLTQTYAVPYLWTERIVVMPNKLKNWHLTPSHFLNQDLTDVWLEQ